MINEIYDGIIWWLPTYITITITIIQGIDPINHYSW